MDAVFVGWGHASENPKLGEMLIQKTKELGRKITFVGPTSPGALYTQYIYMYRYTHKHIYIYIYIIYIYIYPDWVNPR